MRKQFNVCRQVIIPACAGETGMAVLRRSKARSAGIAHSRAQADDGQVLSLNALIAH